MGAGSACLIAFLTIGFVIAGILVACSFDTLDPLEAGIRDNTITKAIQSSRVYTSGRWMVGLGNSFIRFPTTYQTVKFSNDTNSDGIPLLVNSPLTKVACTFQYTLNLSMLISTYRSFGTQYHTRYVKIAKDIIQSNTDATHFNSSQFYSNRRAISDALLVALSQGMVQYGAIVHDFQMNEVVLQDSTESTIVTNIVQEQIASTTTLNGTVNLINAKTAVIQGEQQQLIQLYLANTTRNASILTQTAAAKVTQLLVNADSVALLSLKSELNFTNAETLQYVWLRNLRVNSSQSTLAIGLPSPILAA